MANSDNGTSGIVIKNIKFSVPLLAAGHALSKFATEAIRQSVEYERLFNELAISGTSSKEVKEFCAFSSLPFEYVKRALLLGAELNDDEIHETMLRNLFIRVRG